MIKLMCSAAFLIFVVACVSGGQEQPRVVTLKSPAGIVEARIFIDDAGRLRYTVKRGGSAVIDKSDMGIVIDKVDLGTGIEMGAPKYSTHNERYPWRGVKSEAIDHYNSAILPFTHLQSVQNWALEARSFDDGFAYRYIVSGEGKRKVNGEKSNWNLPDGSEIWYHFNTVSYEDIHQKSKPQDIPRPKGMAFPITVELPDGTYAAITEGALFNYSGMTAMPTRSTVLQGVFEDNPTGWELQGVIKSPWRIVMTGPDLNALVNCDIVHNLCPPASKKLFPKGFETDWIKPGRALWHWWSGTAGNFDGVAYDKQFWWIDNTAELGFEYYLIDAGWERAWSEPGKDKWALLGELCNYAKKKGVGIFVWKRWRYGQTEGVQMTGLDTKELRQEFFKHCKETGVAGLKIDFMDSESKERIDFYTDVLREAAERQLMINFHGANKPTGESRTFPNEVTREGARGLEYVMEWNRGPKPPHHNVSLPFTRMLAGHADFTPCTFTEHRLFGTTLTAQVAMAIVLSSPLLHYADKPDLYLESPALPVIKRIPSVWDETRVLPDSRIGELAAFARRSNNRWFVGIINGSESESRYHLDLSFLGEGEYNAMLVRDNMNDPTQMNVVRITAAKGKTIEVQMCAGGGFVAAFWKQG